MKIDIDRILYFNDYTNKKMKKPKKLDVWTKKERG